MFQYTSNINHNLRRDNWFGNLFQNERYVKQYFRSRVRNSILSLRQAILLTLKIYGTICKNVESKIVSKLVLGIELQLRFVKTYFLICSRIRM